MAASSEEYQSDISQVEISMRNMLEIISSQYSKMKDHFSQWRPLFYIVENFAWFVFVAVDACLVTPLINYMGGKEAIIEFINTSEEKIQEIGESVFIDLKAYWERDADLEDDWNFACTSEKNDDGEREMQTHSAPSLDENSLEIGSTQESESNEDSITSSYNHIESPKRKKKQNENDLQNENTDDNEELKQCHGSDEESVVSYNSERNPWWRRIFKKQKGLAPMEIEKEKVEQRLRNREGSVTKSSLEQRTGAIRKVRETKSKVENKTHVTMEAEDNLEPKMKATSVADMNTNPLEKENLHKGGETVTVIEHKNLVKDDDKMKPDNDSPNQELHSELSESDPTFSEKAPLLVELDSHSEAVHSVECRKMQEFSDNLKYNPDEVSKETGSLPTSDYEESLSFTLEGDRKSQETSQAEGNQEE